jgi:hypothetical protein
MAPLLYGLQEDRSRFVMTATFGLPYWAATRSVSSLQRQ